MMRTYDDLADLVLDELNARPDADVLVVAPRRDSASIAFRAIADRGRRRAEDGTDELELELKVRAGYQRLERGAARARVVVADADHLDGVRPTLAVLLWPDRWPGAAWQSSDELRQRLKGSGRVVSGYPR